MKISYSLLLYTSKKLANNEHPVALRLTYDAKPPKYITIARLKERDWDPDAKRAKSSAKNYSEINRTIKLRDAEAEDLVLDFNNGKSKYSPDQIVKILRRETNVSETVFDFLCDMVEDYKSRKKYDEASSLESKAKNIWSFVNNGLEFPIKSSDEIKYGGKSILRQRNGRDLGFLEVNDVFLRKLKIFLEMEKGLGRRYIFNHFNMLSTIYGRGQKFHGLTEDKNPFNDFSISRPKSQKVGLEKAEVESIEKVKLEAKTDTWIDAKNAFLFTFAFAGQRIADALSVRWTRFEGGKVRYTMRKNGKPIELPIPKRAQKVLDYYEQFKLQNKGYVFPALRKADLNDPVDINRKIKTAVKQYNVWLKKIAKAAKVEKNLTNHISRHTFGKLAGSKIPMPLLQIYYNHADIQTTANYQQDHIDQEQLDENLEAIVDF